MAEPVGRPPIYTDPAVLSAKCSEWLAKYLDENGDFILGIANPPTINGLSRFLGFCSKTTLYEYSESNEVEISEPVKKCITLVEEWHERGLSCGQCTGHIFGLKNSGWRDHTSQELSGGLRVLQIECPPDKPAGAPCDILA